MKNFFLVLIETEEETCPHDLECFWGGARKKCADVKKVREWSAFCAHGHVVSVYDSAGKARAQATRLMRPKRYYHGPTIYAAKAMKFSIDDLTEITDDLGEEYQALENKMVKAAVAADAVRKLAENEEPKRPRRSPRKK